MPATFAESAAARSSSSSRNLLVGRHSAREMLCIKLELHGGPLHPREDQEKRDQHRWGHIENGNAQQYCNSSDKTQKGRYNEPCCGALPDVAGLLCSELAERRLELAGEALLQILADCELQGT